MFTGIIESVGHVEKIEQEGSNRHLWVSCSFVDELQIDQSVAHNGVCLTVVEIEAGKFKVTAIEETLRRSNIGDLREGSTVNLERCMPANGRFDGHIVQGHVDQTAVLDRVDEVGGSWNFFFRFASSDQAIVVEKGSITINGVSLTVVNAGEDHCSVSIIPYTYEHTNFRTLKPGDRVNLEFDILGKYVMEAQRRLVGQS